MKFSRRLAWIAFVVALLLILIVGFIRATMHDETRPDTGPAPTSTVQSR